MTTTPVDRTHLSASPFHGPGRNGAKPAPETAKSAPDAAKPDDARPSVTRKPLHAPGITRAQLPAPAESRPVGAPVGADPLAGKPSVGRPDSGHVATPGEPLTPEGLQEAWGRTDSPYDLNHDRIVNIDDMIQLIMRMPPEEGTVVPATPVEPTEAPQIALVALSTDEPAGTGAVGEEADEPAAPTVDGFDEAWGRSNTPYDVDGNGTVNIDDLVSFILNMNAAEPSDGVAPDGITAGSAETATPLTLEGLREAWGESNSRYDLDGNGTVNIDDLVQFVMHGPDGHGSRDEAPVVPERIAEPGVSGPERIARSIIHRLEAAGFENRLPTNIRELLEALDLKPGEEKQVAGQLAEKFPKGIGVSLVG